VVILPKETIPGVDTLIKSAAQIHAVQRSSAKFRFFVSAQGFKAPPTLKSVFNPPQGGFFFPAESRYPDSGPLRGNCPMCCSTSCIPAVVRFDRDD
jgi:hypothetical protein